MVKHYNIIDTYNVVGKMHFTELVCACMPLCLSFGVNSSFTFRGRVRSMAASFLLAGGISWGFGFPGDTFLPMLLFDWSNE